ncbi:MAG: DJ-1/PfpI family protein [Spirochaetales bacterium]|nr:DJ-1/PfpI family protein [Spirochaetales bacterium]
MKQIVVCLANGFEEVEAVTAIDVLRRAKLDVVVAGVGTLQPRGSRGLNVVTDMSIENVAPRDVWAVILPGGMPGASNLAASPEVESLCRFVVKSQGYLGAICAAPAVVLEKFALLQGRQFTCYPGFESHCQDGKYIGGSVVEDGHLITGEGPGAAMEFALKLVNVLAGDSRFFEVRKGLFPCE